MKKGPPADQKALPVLFSDRDVAGPITPTPVLRRDCSVEIPKHFSLPRKETVPEWRIQDLREESLDLAGPALRLAVRADLAPGVRGAVRAGIFAVLSHTAF